MMTHETASAYSKEVESFRKEKATKLPTKPL
jgi:hypothetical protein